MATCAKDVLDLTDSDVLLMAVSYIHGKKNPYRHVSVIGRAPSPSSLWTCRALSCGGTRRERTSKGASASFRMDQPLPNATLVKMQEEGHVDGILDHLVDRVVEGKFRREDGRVDGCEERLQGGFKLPDITMAEVGEILETHDYRSCPVISHDGRLMGVVSITEVDVAAIKGQLDRPVSRYMKLPSAVTLDTPVSECERILVEQGEGCIPVVENYEDPKKQWRMAGAGDARQYQDARVLPRSTAEYFRAVKELSKTAEGDVQRRVFQRRRLGRAREVNGGGAEEQMKGEDGAA